MEVLSSSFVFRWVWPAELNGLPGSAKQASIGGRITPKHEEDHNRRFEYPRFHNCRGSPVPVTGTAATRSSAGCMWTASALAPKARASAICRSLAGPARLQRHPVANLVQLDRQDGMRTRTLATVRLQPPLRIKATRPFVALTYPQRQEAVARGTRVVDYHLHQALRHPRPRDLLGHVEAVEFSDAGENVGGRCGRSSGQSWTTQPAMACSSRFTRSGRDAAAASHAAQQLPGVTGMVAVTGDLLDHGGDAGKRPGAGVEPVGAGALAQRLVDGGKLACDRRGSGPLGPALRSAANPPCRQQACQRLTFCRPTPS
jgi:hypothetical protein